MSTIIADLIRAGVDADLVARVAEEIAAARAAMPGSPTQSPGAKRQAAYRARLRGQVTESDACDGSDVTRNEVTKSDVTEPVTLDVTRDVTCPPNDISNPPRSSLRSVSPQARAEWFSEFWSAYPRRTGTNPKQPAQERFLRLLKADPDPDALARAIIDGAKRFAASVVGEDPRFTMQAKRWLNEGCWKDDHRPAAPRQRSGVRDGPSRSNGANAVHQDLLAELEPGTVTVIPPGEEPRDPFLRAGVRKLAEYENRDRARSGASSAAAGIASVIYPGSNQR